MKNHLNGLLKGEDTGEIVGGHFTGAVSDHRIGGDMPNCLNCSASAI